MLPGGGCHWCLRPSLAHSSSTCAGRKQHPGKATPGGQGWRGGGWGVRGRCGVGRFSISDACTQLQQDRRLPQTHHPPSLPHATPPPTTTHKHTTTTTTHSHTQLHPVSLHQQTHLTCPGKRPRCPLSQRRRPARSSCCHHRLRAQHTQRMCPTCISQASGASTHPDARHCQP